MNEPHPLFIVGCPRSGTKLIRALLNNHPDVSLGGEGYYIPRLVKRFGMEADFSQVSLWREVHEALRQTPFYQNTKEPFLTEEAFIKMLQARVEQGAALSWTEVFEVILRGHSPRSDTQIFGDKSTGYISSVPLLRNLFANVRFIYIVRDPRDQALSVQRTWGRSPLRSAQGWYHVAHHAERYGFEGAPDAFILRYEDLTADPHAELERVCAFLEIPFVEAMATLKRPAEREHHGRQLHQVTKQQAKYRGAFSPKVIRKISEITFPYLSKHGYDEEGATRHVPLSKLQLRQLSYSDGLASLQYHVKDKGMLKGLRYYGAKRYASWVVRKKGTSYGEPEE